MKVIFFFGMVMCILLSVWVVMVRLIFVSFCFFFGCIFCVFVRMFGFGRIRLLRIFLWMCLMVICKYVVIIVLNWSVCFWFGFIVFSMKLIGILFSV